MRSKRSRRRNWSRETSTWKFQATLRVKRSW